MLFERAGTPNLRGVWSLRPDSRGGWEESPIVDAGHIEADGAFSSDGRYIAYTSDETGQSEVYVRRFAEEGGKWRASANGGHQPRWREDGAELFYLEQDKLMAVNVRFGAGG